MAPKGKEKVEADLIPQWILNKYKIVGKAFKILRESQQWNDVLISKSPRHVLRGISGLDDTMIDKIREGLNKYMDTLESEASVFIQEMLSSYAWLKHVILEAKDYVRQFYSREKVIQKVFEKFHQPEEQTNQMYDLWFTSKSRKAKNAYLEMSAIRASQRKVEANELEMASLLKDELGNLVAEKNELKEEAEHKLVGEEKSEEGCFAAFSDQKEKVTRLMEALKLQEKMVEEIKSYQPDIATKDELESLQIGIIRKLEYVGEELASGVTSGIEKILTL